MDSILTSIKKLLGISEEQTSFDQDLIIHINSVFMILNHLGVGPPEGFSIKDTTNVWSDFIPLESSIEAVKSYTYLKVRLIFDPPSNSVVVNAITETIRELEWRINAIAETSMEANKDLMDLKAYVDERFSNLSVDTLLVTNSN